jgi:pyridoxal phosphate enzyme (YggS family)
MPNRRAEIAAGLAETQQRIARACAAADRPLATLVVVTKTFPASDIRILHELGVRDVAENRDQEAQTKVSELADLDLTWHCIGQIQRKKARSVVKWADVIESVDRLPLVAALDRAATDVGRRPRVYIQVSLDENPAENRGGAAPADVPSIAEAITSSSALDLAGIMAVAPFPGDPDLAFSRLAAIHSELCRTYPKATVVSAGMSQDLEQAIAHGATQVRIGGAILGNRPPVE